MPLASPNWRKPGLTQFSRKADTGCPDVSPTLEVKVTRA